MSPAELLEALDAAEAQPRSRKYVLETTAPVVLGVRGKFIETDQYGAVYGFTRRQCRKIRRVIVNAIREDFG